ncbi:MAG: hypothetical protein EP343_19720 [Deltaproteobacteria bacterium]|nr:MAG: hypothetical protein EP343_19720 [Deltaproteobacteria bacterium]
MFRWIRSLLVVGVIVGGLGFATVGCGGFTCEGACNKSADCAGATGSQREQGMQICVAACNATKTQCAEVYNCFMSKSCGEISSCGTCNIGSGS